jgi:hypothetical protein
MSEKKSFWLKNVYDALFEFFIGDDWVLALGAVMVLGLTALVSNVLVSWWVVLLGVPLVLWYSLRRATRSS